MVIKEVILVRSYDVKIIMFDGIIVSFMCGEPFFKIFWYHKCLNCLGVSAVVSRKRSFLHLSISFGMLISDKPCGI